MCVLLFNRLMESQTWERVRTLVLDECQEYFGGHEIREETYQKMLKIISKLKVQKVFDSATLPVGLMDVFVHKVHLAGNPPSYITICQESYRPELAHHVLSIPLSVSRSALDVTTELAKTLQGLLKDEERMIVFVMQVEHADHLSGTIGCPQYHSSLPEREGKGKERQHPNPRTEVRTVKDRNHDCWVGGQSKVIVATPALIQGIDYPWVRFVVFHQGAFGLISYYQGAGRGGRSGSRCDVFTILDPRVGFSLKDRPHDIEGAEAWMRFTSTPGCRVGVISSYFDGGDKTDCRNIEGQQRCDNCLPTDHLQLLATQIVDKQAGQPLVEGGSKRPADNDASPSEPWDRDPSWDAAIYAEADKIEERELKRSRSDQRSGPFAASRACSGPASASYSCRAPSTPQGSAPRQSLPRTASSGAYGPRTVAPSSNFFPRTSRNDKASFSSPSSGSYRSTPIPPSSNSGMVGNAIIQAATANSASDIERKRKSVLLDSFMPALIGNCPVCFILTGKRVDSDEIGFPLASDTKHRPFHDCPLDQLLGTGPHPTANDFINWRGTINLQPAFRYCYTCAMPQTLKGDNLEPACHKAWGGSNSSRRKLSSKNANGKGSCPWANIIQASVFILRFDRRAMQDLLPHFNFTTSDDPNVSLAEWTQFLNIDLADQGEYWKGLEVFLFKAAEYGLVQNL
jgi:hypothetical protein